MRNGGKPKFSVKFLMAVAIACLLILSAGTPETAYADTACVYCEGKGAVPCVNPACQGENGGCAECDNGFVQCAYCGGTGRQEEAPTDDPASCGEHLTWEMDAQGTLTISGSGPMKDFSTGAVPWNAFSVKRVTIQEGVTSIGSHAFAYSSLTEVTIPSTVTSIHSWAFSSSARLASVTIPEGVETIGLGAFMNCKSLESVIIPESASKVDSTAFYNCSSLKSVTLLGAETGIGSHAFSSCADALVFYCVPDANALKYAKANNIVSRVISDKPIITAQPSDATVAVGETATFTVDADNAASYQWFYRKSSSGEWISVKNNGTSAAYHLATNANHNGYQFRCLVENDAASEYSNIVTLTVDSAPVITAQPVDAVVNAGETATFTVTATGAAAYQWYYRKSASADWISVKNNGTADTYILATAASHNGYQFRCLVENDAGNVYTDIVTLTVQ